MRGENKMITVDELKFDEKEIKEVKWYSPDEIINMREKLRDSEYIINVKIQLEPSWIFYLILKENPQLYWGKEKTYSYDESNKKHQTKDDIIFGVDSYKYKSGRNGVI